MQVGFHSGWHTALVMGQVSRRVHAKRLAQAEEVEITLEAHGALYGVTHMQLDGEPWEQRVPGDKILPGGAETGGDNSGKPLVVRVRRAGQSRMLLNDVEALGPKTARQVTSRGAMLSKMLAVAGP
jgi:ribosomal protein S6E (S10)